MAGLLLAIDPASITGIARGKPGTKPILTRHILRVSDEPVELVYQRGVELLDKELRKGDLPDEMVIEAPFATVNTTFDVAKVALGLYGIFCGIALWRGIRVRPAPIGTWRKAILGRGNMPGPEAKEAAELVCRRLGWDAPDHNAAESGCIWLWGCGQIDPRLAPRIEPLFDTRK